MLISACGVSVPSAVDGMSLSVLFACNLMSLFCLDLKLISTCVVLAPSTVDSFMWARRYSAAMLLLFRHVTCVSLIPVPVCPWIDCVPVPGCPGAGRLPVCPCARVPVIWCVRVPGCPCARVPVCPCADLSPIQALLDDRGRGFALEVLGQECVPLSKHQFSGCLNAVKSVCVCVHTIIPLKTRGHCSGSRSFRVRSCHQHLQPAKNRRILVIL